MTGKINLPRDDEAIVALVATAIAICAFKRHAPKAGDPHWEVVPARNLNDELIGYQVRWSEPDDQGRYLWVGHYFEGDSLSIGWCEVAAKSDARRKNESKVGPWKYR